MQTSNLPSSGRGAQQLRAQQQQVARRRLIVPPAPAPPVHRPPPELLAEFPTVAELVGNTPIVRLQHLPGDTSNIVLAKLEGHNPAGSAKDRPALHMLSEAERRGQIRKGDTIIEATSGNTGIALAMAAAIKGYKLKLILPASSSEERKATMAAYGAEVILADSMEAARDMLLDMERQGQGHCLDQYNNEEGVDRIMDITAREAEETARALARVEGVFAGISGAGAVSAALRLSAEIENAIIVAVVCDRGDRYLSTGVYNESAGAEDPAPVPAAEFHSALARLLHAHAGPHYVLFTDGDAPPAGPLAGARAVVEAGGGRLLEVRTGGAAEREALRASAARRFGLELAPGPSLVAWSRAGVGAVLPASALAEAATSEAAAAAAVQAFIRDTWDGAAPGGAEDRIEHWMADGLGL
ncbi:cysteine synthase B [Raphidocelis subcapitata]|uniref:Cysteine synthase B n=1 Tax=Raphidocelis subcapitata TaxID=307507 RepID=A0A2V0NW25_9CHLO|nr:cysteine synthase B [Raphidocelis subcapitata]|eukprot:GBF91826.1 cysteine synthase B [Raphidocelis subcapitata]